VDSMGETVLWSGGRDSETSFHRESHILYFKECLKSLPQHYVSLDTTRLSAVYFCVLGLDILRASLNDLERENVIEFVYANQLSSVNNEGHHERHPGHCGFMGSSASGQGFGECCKSVVTLKLKTYGKFLGKYVANLSHYFFDPL
jgi:hypothetical protein